MILSSEPPRLTDLPASEVALQYKHPLTVERFFRAAEEERVEI